jgi:hypothetical protein
MPRSRGPFLLRDGQNNPVIDPGNAVGHWAPYVIDDDIHHDIACSGDEHDPAATKAMAAIQGRAITSKIPRHAPFSIEVSRPPDSPTS